MHTHTRTQKHNKQYAPTSQPDFSIIPLHNTQLNANDMKIYSFMNTNHKTDIFSKIQ